MSVTEFLAGFDAKDFPYPYGPWLNFEEFDPPYKRAELRQMRQLGVIYLQEKLKRFRLTLSSLAPEHRKAA